MENGKNIMKMDEEVGKTFLKYEDEEPVHPNVEEFPNEMQKYYNRMLKNPPRMSQMLLDAKKNGVI